MEKNEKQDFLNLLSSASSLTAADIHEIRIALNQLESRASRAEQSILIKQLEERNINLLLEVENLSAANSKLLDIVNRMENASDLKGKNGEIKPVILGIVDLEKKNEEAVFDALAAFDKRCPYCGKDQYRIGIRDRIEIDHFVPIARGGQDIPWNLLPVCKSCNRKKKDRLPVDFLDRDTYMKCSVYLLKVRQRYEGNEIFQHQGFSRLKDLARQNTDFLRENFAEPLVKEFVQLVVPELTVEATFAATSDVQQHNADGTRAADSSNWLISQIKSRYGVFEKGVVTSPWGPVCAAIESSAPTTVGQISRSILIQSLVACGWKDLGNIHSREFPNKRRAFRAPDLIEYNKAALRRLAESSHPHKTRE